MNQQLITLVIGASEKQDRYSNMAIRSLLQHGHQVRAIGSRSGSESGVTWDRELVVWEEPIDTITLYINPKIQENYYNYIIGLKPRRVIFNPGTENPQLIQSLKDNGIESVIACTLVMLSIGTFD